MTTWRKSSYSGAVNCVQVAWRKSTYSVGNGACTEVAVMPSPAADSLETIKQTHGRYFYSAAELASRMARWLPA